MPALCVGGSLTIVAHPDDDLLFFNPDILRDIEAGRWTRTVFVTAGEAGEGQLYWGGLEAGIFATYAQMAGVPDDWTATDAGVTAGRISVHTLTDAPHVSVVFLRIPDGFDGSGSAAYGWESLATLWAGSISTITSVDGEEWYTKDEVRDILVQLMTNFEPTTVRVQDWTTDPDNLDDHSDHCATAKFAEYDKYLCGDPSEGCPTYPHDAWLARQYHVSIESTKNAAREDGVTVAASSSKGTAQRARKAIDGYPVGAPMDAAHEWVTSGEGAGSWIELTFPSPTPLDGVTLFDRMPTTR
jgi:LmbE family N-acetylglucosaminyl deacetylase